MTTRLQQQHPDWSMMLAAGTTLFIAMAFFAAIVAHEMDHSLVAIRRGLPVMPWSACHGENGYL